jgi:hypothetical protein
LKELEKKPQDVPQIVIVERTERPADDTHEKKSMIKLKKMRSQLLNH